MPERRKTVLITGASSGIGYACAIEFARKGYFVFAGARRVDKMADLKKYGVRLLELDITLDESIAEVKQLVTKEANGQLDILFNNAGQMYSGAALDLEDGLLQKLFDVNVFGHVKITRELSSLVINAKGTIGFTSSVMEFTPLPFGSPYAMSKAAIMQYAACLRLELKPFGVRVIDFASGAVESEIGGNTVAIPSTSLYNIPDFENAISQGRERAQKNIMRTNDYAKKVVQDFESLKSVDGKFRFRRGTGAVAMYWAASILPYIVYERLFISQLNLSELYRIIKKKYANVKID